MGETAGDILHPNHYTPSLLRRETSIALCSFFYKTTKLQWQVPCFCQLQFNNTEASLGDQIRMRNGT